MPRLRADARGGNRALDLGGVAHVDRAHLHAASDGATDWMAANWLGPEVRAGSRMTPASRGAISFIGAVEPRARLLGHADLSAYVAQQYGQYDQARSPRDHDPE
jgi:hypothetical protein